MAGSPAAQANDPLLEPYLRTCDEAASERELSLLLTVHAQPIVSRIVGAMLRSKTRWNDADLDDVQATTMLYLVRHLRELKSHPERRAISDYRAYVATTAHNGCNEYFRALHPERARLRYRLLYVLRKHPGLALWRSAAGEWTAGLRGWSGREGDREREPQNEARNTLADIAGNRDPLQVSLPETLLTLFARLATPIRFDELLAAFASWAVAAEGGERPDPASLLRIADPVDVLERIVEPRISLSRVWSEIIQLPLRQRTALLLNLRDSEGRDIIAILPYTRTASLDEIAQALEMEPEHFAQLWKELPVDDAWIAQFLGATRQQVIKLRRVARERLRRRMKRLETSTAPEKNEGNRSRVSPSEHDGER